MLRENWISTRLRTAQAVNAAMAAALRSAQCLHSLEARAAAAGNALALAAVLHNAQTFEEVRFLCRYHNVEFESFLEAEAPQDQGNLC
ncbi:hypothetical protein SBOR_7760 [Sclerotinia borealis F-4128]|uniref:Uncharacterized protein n=1 Tax=Sclerotinia borealis (strain F-4128) TaxID=1432307 RepID=W9CAG9_SCLBF|nr:hypothetical protein SBOR_7760 [Sclerotinia borealis F-4128]